MERYLVFIFAIVLLLVECQACTYRKTTFVVVVRGGTSPSSSEEEDDFRPKKKRRMTREEIIEEQVYEEDEEDWFESTREFSTEEDAFVLEEADRPKEEEDDDVGYEEDEVEPEEKITESSIFSTETKASVPEIEAQQQLKRKSPSTSSATTKTNVDAVPEPVAAEATDIISDDHPEAGSSSPSSVGNVDRMELADAYDDDMAALTSDAPKVIDAQTERILKRDLKYSGREIAQMKPAVAAVVAAKRLHRPSEGMPRNWYVSPPKLPEAKKIQWKPVIRKLIIPVTVVVFVITQGEATLEMLMTSFSGIEESRHPSQDQTSFPEEEDPYAASLQLQEASPTTDPPPLPELDHKPHSIKPGQLPDDELDVTWLDKLLTAVERKLTAFFRWKI